jgi:hypothetical protein
MTGRASIAVATALALLALPSGAKVSQEQAARLGKDLTPVGGERAGNGGDIPEWTGGLRQVPPGWKPGQPRINPFADDKPRFSIDASNMQSYASRLSPGQQALLQRTKGYRMDVYQTRRSCAFPEWVYEATRRNATTAELDSDGVYLKQGWHTVLFPIPTSGAEAIFNHQYAFFSEGKVEYNATFAPTKTGDITPTLTKLVYDAHIFDPEVASLAAADGRAASVVLERLGPPRLAGQVVLVHEMVNDQRRGWIYNPGQRRVRRTPTVAYDNPLAGTESLMTNDMVRMLNGIIDRFDWKVVGKQELYVPYNVFDLNHRPGLTIAKAYGASYPQRDLIRYELHRVHVIEGTLKQGKRHIFSKRVFYVDEDSWVALVEDLYDKGGNLWRVMEGMMTVIPELPTCSLEGTLAYDLVAGRYAADQVKTEQREDDWLAGREGRIPEGIFTPDALRRVGKR